eukprot:CAMPEP_0177646290 /NCGR_PEP_ID=MMETSP0447-20121125/9697_1 /TAXON_ID=0 /ORGANISM="Stygamoeba regulata, Strain BSH-02190019" /LENGTH=76 /DNA_ID=CAMNT_0019148817 /DNA_START=145 /DNA_END=375 /DNA_ORIENTATION=-
MSIFQKLQMKPDVYPLVVAVGVACSLSVYTGYKTFFQDATDCTTNKATLKDWQDPENILKTAERKHETKRPFFTWK